MRWTGSVPVRLAASDPLHTVGAGDGLAGDAGELGHEVPVTHRDAAGEPLADGVDGLADPAGEQLVGAVVPLGAADGVDEPLDGLPGSRPLDGDDRSRTWHG